jgi:ribosomal protein S18 acetylase RimI-like enzyme
LFGLIGSIGMRGMNDVDRRPTIRPVEERDLQAVRAVLVETWHATYDAVLGAARVTEITDDWHSIAALERESGPRPAYAFLLLEDDGATVATASASRRGDTVVVLRLYVLPAHQRRGHGTALLDALVARLGPTAHVELDVAATNAPAIAFYERRGFVVRARDGDDLVMRRDGSV